jgi:hypothetical protein
LKELRNKEIHILTRRYKTERKNEKKKEKLNKKERKA